MEEPELESRFVNSTARHLYRFASSMPSYRERETDGIRIDRHSHRIRFHSQQVSCDYLRIPAYIHTLVSVHMESEVLFLSLKSYVSLSEILESWVWECWDKQFFDRNQEAESISRWGPGTCDSGVSATLVSGYFCC